jgi:hypothetical protein
MVMKGTTIVPLLFTSMMKESRQVDGDKPLYAFLYKAMVFAIIRGSVR